MSHIYLHVPRFVTNTHSTIVERITTGRPMKLMHKQCLFNSIKYVKHDNINGCKYFQWNLAHSTLCDDVIFIVSNISCITCL